ncbi:MAG: hypothetical protein J0M35_17865 [Candidatus Obscuribacter phosphatis]|uniref:Uncharacterized protein n=1 Tax=Candidatus Obscuribacter phosphatis TaxID=1906157 RepID=A0A8J7TNM2_9BACT|nr:hypothetical protein [Candidatus Obscuribacter phosphatis]
MPAPDQSISNKIRLPQVLVGLLVFLLLQIGLFMAPGQTQPEQAPTENTHAEQAEPEQAEPGQANSGQANSGQALNNPGQQVKPAGMEAMLQQRAWQRLTQANDVTFPKEIRYPFIYSRKALNLTWRPGFVFAIIMFMTLVLRFFAPKSLKEATEKCREGIFLSLTAAFVFTAIAMTLTKAAFYSDALSPLGLMLTGFTQLAYLVGIAVGANALALSLIEKIGKSSRKAELFALTITITLLSLLALIPDLGPLPRIGNRLLGILAMLGLGGLIRAKYRKSKDD